MSREGKVAIVTGSNSGIGKESARQLVAKGFHVVLACRSQDKADAAAAEIGVLERVEAKTAMTVMLLDTSKMASVKAFAAAFLAKFSRLDVLVHNAGSGYFPRDLRTTEDGLEAFFQTNYLGPFLLSKLLLDMLKKCNGRVVCVSSIEHWEGSYEFQKATAKTGAQSYPTSKLMLTLHAFELRKRHGVLAVAANPGGVSSDIWRFLRGWKKTVFETIVAPTVLLTPQQGCQTTVHAATAAAESFADGPVYLSPYRQWSVCPRRSDFLNFYSGPAQASTDPLALDEAKWSELWEFSEEKVKPFL
jgi:NAD(P)-dependent dehydrogenase (short-subunit alcohol dehydrogenase family)